MKRRNVNLGADNDRTTPSLLTKYDRRQPKDMSKQAKYMVEHTKMAWTVMSRKGSSDVVVSDENVADMKSRGYSVVKRYAYTPTQKELLESFSRFLDECNGKEVT